MRVSPHKFVQVYSEMFIDNRSQQRVNKRFNVLTDASQSPQVCSTSPPKTWSVVEVVKFIEKSELAEHADMFRKHVSSRLTLTIQLNSPYL